MDRHGSYTRRLRDSDLEVRVVRACEIEVVAGPASGVRAVVDRPIYRIGSHSTNDLVVPDDTVSKHHLELKVVPDGYRLVDLGSSNGTVSRAFRIHDLTVTGPIELDLGTTRLRIRPTGDEVEVAASLRTGFGPLVGRSAVMRELFAHLEVASASDATVLIQGESGAGKDLVAEAIHQASSRAGGPLVVVDASALTRSLGSSELFGHVRGAFTGAHEDRPGLLIQADGGTLFLDEVGELPVAVQPQLLRPLERGEVTPVGATRPVRFDARVLAATHRDLAREVNRGRFRADLFYRLAVMRVEVPPLRERLDDLPLLVAAILAELRERDGDRVPSQLSAVTMARFSAQPWPGNVRELRNTIEALVAGVVPHGGEAATGPGTYVEARARALQAFDRTYLLELLESADLNVSEAARRAGLERRNFYRLLRRTGIDLDQLR